MGYIYLNKKRVLIPGYDCLAQLWAVAFLKAYNFITRGRVPRITPNRVCRVPSIPRRVT